MVQICIALLTTIALAIMSFRANRRLSQERRLPMQWSISGSVNWTAPRAVALAFMPVIGAIGMTAVAIATLTTDPRPGQEGLEIPVMMVMSVGLVAIHALHLWLIDRTVKRERR